MKQLKKMILDVKDNISKFYSYNLYHIDSLGTNQIRKRHQIMILR